MRKLPKLMNMGAKVLDCGEEMERVFLEREVKRSCENSKKLLFKR
jgi:hypothetical protein